MDAVLAALNTTCTECGHTFPPNEIMRIDFDTMRCPKSGAVFTPKKKK
ncbi:MAG TPA: hypothetical protein VMG82_32140 [Candidatus Sulfotelmatobacter sp.]|nr:hypothetical protein [Candidatus Sulfotelmatobacter sp.]